MIHLLLLLKIVLIFCVGFITAFITTNVGGATLLLVPTLIFAGLGPQVAIATARLGTLGAKSTGLYGFHNGGQVDYKVGLPAAIFGIIGAIIGANVLVVLSYAMLYRVIGFLILLTLIIVFVEQAMPARLKIFDTSNGISRTRKIIGYILFIIPGFIGGLFGGQSIFASFILILVFGESFLLTAGTRKIIGLAITATALIIYGLHHFIDWQYGILLLTGMGLGSYFGAAYGIKKGERWIQRLFIVVVIVMAAKLIFL